MINYVNSCTNSGAAGQDYSSAVHLYRSAGARCLKIALKLAEFGCVEELLAFLQVSEWNPHQLNQCFGSGSEWIPFISASRIRVAKNQIK